MAALRKIFRIVTPQSQQGAALIIAVMILLILTVLGIYAVTTSTLETKIAGNERVLKDAFYAADGGVDYGRHVIESFLTSKNPDLPGGASVKPNETSFREEMLGTDTSGSPHVSTHIGNSDMEIHVDRIKAEEPPGYSGEFGAPASGKKTTIYYLIDSTSSGIAGASSQVQATYRRILLE
jgi:Tfp pilus assembly protein PilX